MKSEDYFILYRTSLAASRAFGVWLEKSSLFADIRWRRFQKTLKCSLLNHVERVNDSNTFINLAMLEIFAKQGGTA